MNLLTQTLEIIKSELNLHNVDVYVKEDGSYACIRRNCMPYVFMNSKDDKVSIEINQVTKYFEDVVSASYFIVNQY